MYTEEEILIANKTSRNSNAVGHNALVPRIIIDYITPDINVLDFGAGKQATHAKRLNEQGYNVTAYEFGDNSVKGIHDPQALSRTYAVVYASNVLNVQSNLNMLDNTIETIKKVMTDTGIFIANYPLSPRKFNFSGKEMFDHFKNHFNTVELIHGSISNPVFLLKDKRN